MRDTEGVTDQPSDPYASPPPGWQPPQPPQPPPPPYGAPPGWQPPPPPQPAPPPYGAPPGWQPPPPPYGAPPGWQPPPQQQYGGPGWGPGGYQQPYGYQSPQNINGMAIASLACSIALAIVFGVGGLLGVVFGIVGLKQIKQRNERGRGLAIAGIIIGSLVILFWVIGLLGFIAEDNTNDSGTSVGAHVSISAHR